MAVWQLDEDLWFPDPHLGEPDGLIAMGGDLKPLRLVLAYKHGFFPWYSYRDVPMPMWYCPMERYVIFPNEIHVSHSMRQLLRRNPYELTYNENFEGVINGCSKVNNRIDEEGAWLGPHMIAAYTELHRLNMAASVEVWQHFEAGRKLVGGLYGVTLRHAFFGESMFSLVPSASKLALIFLANHLKETGGKLIDCQFETPLFKSMGGRTISYDEYMGILKQKEG